MAYLDFGMVWSDTESDQAVRDRPPLEDVNAHLRYKLVQALGHIEPGWPTPHNARRHFPEAQPLMTHRQKMIIA